jgi:hypothetical protein
MRSSATNGKSRCDLRLPKALLATSLEALRGPLERLFAPMAAGLSTLAQIQVIVHCGSASFGYATVIGGWHTQ